MKKIIILVVSLFFICSCHISGIHTEKNIREYETDFTSVHIETLSIAGLDNVDFENIINETIESEINKDITSFDLQSRESKNELLMGNRCVLEIKYQEMYNQNSFVSLIKERYTYTGGARGSVVRVPKNIDLNASKEIYLADLFTDNRYEKELNRLIEKEITEHQNEYNDLWSSPKIKPEHQNDFYITDGKLIVFFQPYDLSYYARGFVEFSFDLSELSGFMKEEYKRLIKK